MKICIKNKLIHLFFMILVSVNLNLQAKSIPDFSELADELIPSVVSVSVMISRDVSTNRPVAPQFPPGSPFEDFFKDFFERRGVPAPHQDREEMRLLQVQGLLVIKLDI